MKYEVRFLQQELQDYLIEFNMNPQKSRKSSANSNQK